jgi:hypothetical protein
LYLRREQGQSVSGHEFTRAVKAAKINVGLQPLLISPLADAVLHLRREQGPPQDAVLYLRREQGQSVSGHEFTRAVKAAKINVGLQPLLISPLVLHSRREQGPSGP